MDGNGGSSTTFRLTDGKQITQQMVDSMEAEINLTEAANEVREPFFKYIVFQILGWLGRPEAGSAEEEGMK